MTSRSGRSAAILAALLAPAAALHAQITTSSLAGRVTSAAGVGVPGVTVVATLAATGERYGAQTNADGRFALANLRPGGPYRVETRRIGFLPQARPNASTSPWPRRRPR